MKPLTQLAVMNDVAEHKAKKISRRTRDGLERGQAEGKQIGCLSTFFQHTDQPRGLAAPLMFVAQLVLPDELEAVHRDRLGVAGCGGFAE